MTLQEIEDKIENCLVKGMEDQITKRNIEDALDELVPCLAFVGRIEQQAELDYLNKVEEGIVASDFLRGERLKLRFVDGYTAKEASYLTRAKRLPKSLDMALSVLQSRLRTETNI